MIEKTNQSNTGQGLVEFSLVIPMLLLLMLGIMEFGRLMFYYSATIASSREAARYGSAIQDIGGGIPQYKDCEGIRNAAKRIGNLAGIGDSNITIQYSNGSTVYHNGCPPTDPVNLADQIVVTTNTTFSPFVALLPLPSFPITSTSSRTILKQVEVGESGTGAGASTGGTAEVNFRTTAQSAYEIEGTGNATVYVDVLLSEPVSDTVSVPFSLTGTADQGDDYTISSSPLTFSAGETLKRIEITLLNDGIPEGNESLVIGLGTPTNADKGPQNIHTVAIMDPPTVSFTTTSSSASEDTSEVVLTVQLSEESYQDVTVPFTRGGTASGGPDYTSSSSPLTIPAGTKSRSLVVNINDDSLDEPDETAVFTIGTPSNALLGANDTHTLTITDNDLPPLVSFQVASQEVSEGLTLTTSVVLSSVSGKNITIPFSLVDDTTTPGDYTLLTDSPLEIPAGARKADIQLQITENDGFNNDNEALVEELNLILDDPTHARLGSPTTQTVTILEDVEEPEISFLNTNQSASEGDGIVRVAVVMSNAYTSDVSVTYGLSGSAEAGSDNDYTISSPNPITIPIGSTVEEIEVQLQDDINDEFNETLSLSLVSVTSGSITSPTSHTVSITDDDPPPTVSFNRNSQSVGELDGSASINVSLSARSAKEITVPFTFSGTADPGEDYSTPSTELIFPPNTISSTFSFKIIDDDHYDDGETVVVTMGTPTNATLGSITDHAVTINDDELPPCDVGTYVLTVGLDSITWSLVNDGQPVVFDGGSITWPAEAGNDNKPILSTITFGGIEIFSGNTKPGTLNFTAAENFPSLTTRDLSFQFKSELASGSHEISISFTNPDSGDTCSLSTTYNK